MRGTIVRSAALAAVLGLVLVPAAIAYQGQVAQQLTVTGPTQPAVAGHSFDVAATVVDAQGAPVAEQAVAWSFATTVDAADALSPAETTTDAQGETSTTVTLGSAPGDRTVTATAGDASASVIVKVSAKGLPNTSTLPQGAPTWQLGAAGLAILLGLTFAARQLVVIRR